MKLRITAIAAGFMLLSGAATAAEVLKVDQMDTVTAAGYGYGNEDWSDRLSGDQGYDKGHHKWRFGHWWHKGKWWDAKCKVDGKDVYGKIDKVEKPSGYDHGDKKPTTSPAAAPINVTINVDTSNSTNVSNIITVAVNGNATNYGDIANTVTQPAPAPKPVGNKCDTCKPHGYWRQAHWNPGKYWGH